MDIVMQRMTITNVEADMDRLIKVTDFFLHKIIILQMVFVWGTKPELKKNLRTEKRASVEN